MTSDLKHGNFILAMLDSNSLLHLRWSFGSTYVAKIAQIALRISASFPKSRVVFACGVRACSAISSLKHFRFSINFHFSDIPPIFVLSHPNLLYIIREDCSALRKILGLFTFDVMFELNNILRTGPVLA